MKDIQLQYAQLTPIREFYWELDNLALYNSQEEIIERIVNNPTLAKYPPSAEYRYTFYKMLISKLESVLDDDQMVCLD